MFIDLGENEEGLMRARDCLEKYLMMRLHKVAWKAVVDMERDKHLNLRIKQLKFLTPEVCHLSLFHFYAVTVILSYACIPELGYQTSVHECRATITGSR